MITYSFAQGLTPRFVLAAMLGLPLATGTMAQEAPKGSQAPGSAPVQLAQATPPAAPGQVPPAAAPAAAPAARPASAPAAASEAVIQPVDLSRYSCQDLMTDMLNKQLDRISMTVTISWGLARAKDDPTNARLDFSQIKPLNEAVWKNCAFGDRARHVRDVVADEMKQVRTSG